VKNTEMITRLRRKLKRPTVDRGLTDDDDLYPELRAAERSLKRMLASRPRTKRLLVEDLGSFAADDSTGETYDFSGGAPGEDDAEILHLEVWTPPGSPRGWLLREVDRTTYRDGYWIDKDNVIHLQFPRVYTPGLFVIAIFGGGFVSASVNSSLPEFLHDLQVLEAAYSLSQQAHSRISPKVARDNRDEKMQEIMTSAAMSTHELTSAVGPWWHSPDLGRG
jgi:hypothetical protein